MENACFIDLSDMFFGFVFHDHLMLQMHHQVGYLLSSRVCSCKQSENLCGCDMLWYRVRLLTGPPMSQTLCIKLCALIIKTMTS